MVYLSKYGRGANVILWKFSFKYLFVSFFLLPLQSQNGNGAIAQLVEQRTENPCVPGSIPGGTT